MLLTTRRTSLIYFCLAGMEAAWLTPLWLLMYRPPVPLGLTYAGILAILLAWTVALELLSRTGLESPAYDSAALGLMALTSALIVVTALGQTRLPARQAFAAIFGFAGGFPPTLAFVVGNLILWQRATSATSRAIGFFEVGVSFRLGLLLLVAGAAFRSNVFKLDLTPLLWVYFGLGLTAVAVAQIHEKAADAQSAGAPLPPRRLAQLLATVALTVAGMALLSAGFTPAGIRRVLGWLDPLWRVLEFLLLGILWLLGLILNPILEWLVRQLTAILRNSEIDVSGLQAPQLGATEPQDILPWLPPWVKTTLTSAAIALAITIAVLLVLGFLVLYLEKSRRAKARDEGELEAIEALTFGGGILRRGLRALRNATRLVRRYGVGRGLLAAISVQNIYANLCRLARQRGCGRPPAQPPDIYLSILGRAFPGQDERLGRITAAYMRVHYGEHSVALAELAGLRADYHAIRETEPESTLDSQNRVMEKP
ncbi:MAG: DUF4129 domain-containing protein [Chloroflexi bacterium]|nr:DUF4129 domain-containing protein [Chloroflexota bacterium]